MSQKAQEQAVEASESVKNYKVDRKAELAELLKSTAEKMSPEGKIKQEEKPVEKTTPEKVEEKPKEKAAKKTSVKSKIQEGKEKVAKTPAKKSKKQEERA